MTHSPTGNQDDRFPYEEKRDIGECAVRNAFYMRDDNEYEFSGSDENFRSHDYFGFSLSDAAADSVFAVLMNSQNE